MSNEIGEFLMDRVAENGGDPPERVVGEGVSNFQSYPQSCEDKIGNQFGIRFPGRTAFHTFVLRPVDFLK